MASRYIAALDQGTTSTRCIIFDQSGKIISSEQVEHRQITPQPGWVEHDPLEILQAARFVLKGALEKCGCPVSEIAALGITNQRETTVIWDKQTGLPLHNAIVWQDTRTAEICSSLAADGGQDRFRASTGLPLATYFSGPKIKWMQDNIPAVREAVLKNQALAGTIDSWLIWNLTGGKHGGLHITDVTNASRTQLMDLKTLTWDSSIMQALGVAEEILPTIRASSDVYAETVDPVFQGVPIAGNLGDQQAALFGQTCYEPGEAKNTYGTGCFMLLNTGTNPVQSTNGLLTTLGYKIGDHPAVYCLEGSVAFAGALIQWLRDNLGIINSSSEVEALARSVSDNGGIYFVPAFSGLFAPYWRSDARGVIAGMTSYANRGHIARAALEATAFQTREVMDAMKSDSSVQLKALKVDGGMVRNDLLMQFQADILNVPVIRPAVTETTALGAAYAAGLAVGFWKNQDQLKANWQVDNTWLPDMDDKERNLRYAGWKKAVTRTFNWTETQAGQS